MHGRPLPWSAARRRRASARATGWLRGLGLCAALAIALLMLAPVWAAAATPGSVAWSHTWNAAKPGKVTDVQAVRAPAGGLYLAATFRRSGGNEDIVVLRYDSSGKRVWTRWYDGPAHKGDRAAGLAVAADGSVTVCGSTAVAGGGDDWVVLRYADNGDRRWVKRLGGASGRNDRAADVVVDGAGNAIVTGTITRQRTGIDWCTAKYAPNGFRRWRAVLSTLGVGDDHPNALALTGDGRIAVAGQFWSRTRGADAGVAMYGATGHLIWRHAWQGLGPSDDVFADVAVGGTSVTAVGETHGALGAGDGLAVRYAIDGGLLWNLVVDGGAEPAGPDRFRSVALDSSGAALVGGSATSSTAAGSDAVVARFAAKDGTQTGWWAWDAGSDDAVADLAVASGGDVFAAGRAGSSSAQALLAGLGHDLTTLWPPVTLGTRAEGRRVVLANGAAYLAGTRGNDLLVASIAR